MFFDSNFLDNLKDKIDITSVISEYITTTKKGRDYWACCPFHVEKTASFQISSVKQTYHCYGCNESGDVIKFIMKFNNLSFYEAVTSLCDKYGVEIPKQSIDYKYIAKKEEKEKVYSINKEAARYYFNNLKSDKGKIALNYLQNKRNLSIDTICKFGIGFSPNFNGLYEHLHNKGFSDENILKSKICYYDEKTKKYSDFFANRVIFPIINYNGEVIGFSARTLEKNPTFAKYKNSPETAAFSKKSVLFGLNMIKKYMPRNEKNIILVEGHLDLISLFNNGIYNVVASMGTALTEEQCKLLKKLCECVYVSYDGDSAGQHATLRGLDLLSNTGLEVKVVELKDNLDPDDYVKKFGKDGYLDLVNKAVPLIQFKLNKIEEEYNPKNSLEDKIKYFRKIKPVINSIDEIEKNFYLDDISNRFSINKNEILKLMEEDEPKSEITKNMNVEKIDPVFEQRMNAERKILNFLIDKQNIDDTRYIVPSLFLGKHKEIFENIVDKFNNNKNIRFSDLYNFYEPESDEPSKIIDVYNDNEATYLDFYSCLKILYTFLNKEIINLLKEVHSGNQKLDKDEIINCSIECKNNIAYVEEMIRNSKTNKNK